MIKNSISVAPQKVIILHLLWKIFDEILHLCFQIVGLLIPNTRVTYIFIINIREFMFKVNVLVISHQVIKKRFSANSSETIIWLLHRKWIFQEMFIIGGV